MQQITALSTADAEFGSASIAVTEGLYLLLWLDSLGFVQKKTTQIYEDKSVHQVGIQQ
jgi:hypothetical protein